MAQDFQNTQVVALGGGHGLAASLRALRRVTSELTAVVGVSDNGGSSGRLREQFNIVPPGDLRMALAALCGDDEWGSTWARVLQHRFVSSGDLNGHALGNLLITALWQETGDVVAGLDWVARLLDAKGRVLPLSTEPLEVFAYAINSQGCEVEILGQVAVALTNDVIHTIGLRPSNPPACPQALAAVRNADVVVLGPGSWFTSVLTHFHVPEMSQALHDTDAVRVLVLNLNTPSGETGGYSAQRYLEVLALQQPNFRLDWVIADPAHVTDVETLLKVAESIGAKVHLADVKEYSEFSDKHDTERLAYAFENVFTSAGI